MFNKYEVEVMSDEDRDLDSIAEDLAADAAAREAEEHVNDAEGDWEDDAPEDLLLGMIDDYEPEDYDPGMERYDNDQGDMD